MGGAGWGAAGRRQAGGVRAAAPPAVLPRRPRARQRPAGPPACPACWRKGLPGVAHLRRAHKQLVPLALCAHVKQRARVVLRLDACPVAAVLRHGQAGAQAQPLQLPAVRVHARLRGGRRGAGMERWAWAGGAGCRAAAPAPQPVHAWCCRWLCPWLPGPPVTPLPHWHTQGTYLREAGRQAGGLKGAAGVEHPVHALAPADRRAGQDLHVAHRQVARVKPPPVAVWAQHLAHVGRALRPACPLNLPRAALPVDAVGRHRQACRVGWVG